MVAEVCGVPSGVWVPGACVFCVVDRGFSTSDASADSGCNPLERGRGVFLYCDGGGGCGVWRDFVGIVKSEGCSVEMTRWDVGREV